MSVNVIKADGTVEPFKVDKLRHSLKRAGAAPTEVNEIVLKIESILHDRIKTQEIYRIAFELLRASDAPVRARYTMRRALFGLGPTGFPFEDFLARLFTVEGYDTKTRVVIRGNCVEHELDVAGFRSDHSFIAEAKFHSKMGIKSDLQVAMYSYARYLDLKNQKICFDDQCGIRDFYLITNTKFTTTAESYAECVGIKLLSWDYPKNDTLHDRIQAVKLYPITVLQSLSMSQKRSLIDRNIITCRELKNKPFMLRHAHISTKKRERVMAEVNSLCSA